MIKRWLEKEIGQRFAYSPAMAILGARQTGKTTLARQIARSLKRKCLFLDLENPHDRARLADPYQYFNMHRDKLVVVDEVQLMPELFSILRPVIDAHRRPKRFLLLGSASLELVRGVSESLAGRVAYTYLDPLHLSELPPSISMNTHWFRGGFPRALLARHTRDSLKWTDDFISTYIDRDLSAIFHSEFSKSLMRRFWQMIAGNNGSVWNAQNFSRSIGLSSPTINRYLDFSEGAFLIRKLPAWSFNSKKRLVKSPKVYIRDSGILHRLNRINTLDDLYGNLVIGASWEGYVIEQILQRCPAGVEGYFYRTQDGAECDLVLVKGPKPVACLEVKISSSPSIPKGFLICANDLGTTNNFVITPSGDEYPAGKNIRVTGLQHFLKNRLRKLVG